MLLSWGRLPHLSGQGWGSPCHLQVGGGQSAHLADTEPGSVPCESLAVTQCDHLSVVTLVGILGRDKPV